MKKQKPVHNLMMRKIVKNWAGSQIVVLDKEDIKLLGTRPGDSVDIQINQVLKK